MTIGNLFTYTQPYSYTPQIDYTLLYMQLLNSYSTFQPAALTPVKNLSSTPIFNYQQTSNNTSALDIFEKYLNGISSAAFKPSWMKDYAADFKKNNYPSASLISLGYNAQKGQKLAQIASQNTVGFTGNCATYVKQDIAQAGLGKYENGHAYQCADILSRNPNFKEISTAGLDLEKLPAGCILVYDKGTAGYSKKYGHIEITDGKGFAKSDGTTANIKNGARVFIPV